MHTIFVSIAAYRDPETFPTLVDLFDKAEYPEDIIAGVLCQVKEGDDPVFTQIPEQWKDNIRHKVVPAEESNGVCWARSRILSELRGAEKFVLQIDSHTRFERNWDTKLLSQLARCESPKPILSSFPPVYTPVGLGDKMYSHMTKRLTVRDDLPAFCSFAHDYASRPRKPVPQIGLAAGLLFAPARAFDEVPYDPNIYFQGEEFTLALRLFTHGWDIFHQCDVVIYHMYRDGGEDKFVPRTLHFQDHPQWIEKQKNSVARGRALMGGKLEGVYGLGNVRPVGAYIRHVENAIEAFGL